MGGLSCVLLSFLLPLWTSLHLVSFAFGFGLFLLTTFFGHESPLWLLSQNKCDEARDLVKRAAFINQKEIKVQTLHPDANKSEKQERKKGLVWTLREVIFNLSDKSTAFYR